MSQRGESARVRDRSSLPLSGLQLRAVIVDDVSSILSFDEKSDMVDGDEGLCFLPGLLLASEGVPSKESWAF